jgi:hypothetical protein
MMAGVLIRSYRGFRQDQATREFQREATKLIESGYVPVSQSWEKAGHPFGLIRKPGTLTVIYHHQGPSMETSEPEPALEPRRDWGHWGPPE